MENAESLEKVGANVEEVEAELKALALKLGPLEEKPLNQRSDDEKAEIAALRARRKSARRKSSCARRS